MKFLFPKGPTAEPSFAPVVDCVINDCHRGGFGVKVKELTNQPRPWFKSDPTVDGHIDREFRSGYMGVSRGPTATLQNPRFLKLNAQKDSKGLTVCFCVHLLNSVCAYMHTMLDVENETLPYKNFEKSWVPHSKLALT